MAKQQTETEQKLKAPRTGPLVKLVRAASRSIPPIARGHLARFTRGKIAAAREGAGNESSPTPDVAPTTQTSSVQTNSVRKGDSTSAPTDSVELKDPLDDSNASRTLEGTLDGATPTTEEEWDKFIYAAGMATAYDSRPRKK